MSTSASTAFGRPALKTLPRRGGSRPRSRRATSSRACGSSTPPASIERRPDRPSRGRAPRRRTTAVYTFAGSLVALARVLDDQPPDAARAGRSRSPPRPRRSPTLAAPSLQRGHMYGTARREPQLAQRAATTARRRCPSARATRRGADCSPRSVPTATGKNARNAPSTAPTSTAATRTPPTWSLPPQLTTSGASAISGTVWRDDEVRQQRPLDHARSAAITTASAIPTTTPSTKPTKREPERVPRAAERPRAPIGRWRRVARVARAGDSIVPHVRHRPVVRCAGRTSRRRGARPPSSGPTAL